MISQSTVSHWDFPAELISVTLMVGRQVSSLYLEIAPPNNNAYNWRLWEDCLLKKAAQVQGVAQLVGADACRLPSVVLDKELHSSPSAHHNRWI